ncbi:MAG TPA: NAD(P)/FAD-dependent oxidoreductase [Anaerolineales bacterium]|nr:NAD(P)/FAD-dependent oxidoreductase [Anaerolineales bacterium]
MEHNKSRQVVIIGAGPAGLTAGYELTKHNIRPIVLEQYDKVGGLARTENYKGYHFDMGGHRFFTKSEPVNEMWHEVLGDEFLRRPRLSRIFYQDKFFYYPLKIWNALTGLGVWQAILIMLSFIRWQIFPYKKEETFEQWVTNRFGKRLFEIFFKTYTEKVWGIPCSELKAEWAAQRIKNLSLKSALMSMVVKPGDSITTLIEEFHYPRLGPGMLWNEVKNQIEKRDGKVHLNSPVMRIHRTGNYVDYVVVSQNGSGEQIIPGTNFISSMPVSEFVKKIEPVPPHVLAAANKLSYRDFLTVCLIVNKKELFPDNWIYIHSPEVKVGRIQNFKNWSPDMVPDPSKTSLGLEYFCTEGDDLWNMRDEDLMELGKHELERIGLAKAGDVVDGCVFRVPKAYPVYDAEYADYLKVVREFVEGLENFQTIGRNGLHRYNNQDHSMITGSLAVRNLLFGEKNDLWSVNADAEYHEEVREDEQRRPEETLKEKITHIFPRLDPVALGFALGTTCGALIFAATLFLLLKDGGTVGPHLQLLSNFVPGFSVTLRGALVGLSGLFVLGFIFGSVLAYLRNLTVYISARIIHRDIELYLLRRLFDFI